MFDQADWPHRQVAVSMRPQGAGDWAVNMIASDGPAALDSVARGEMQLAISNPAMYLALALRGTGPYKAPIALRAITIIPSPDQLAFAVTEKTGIRTFAEIRERRYPLRVSMRGQRITRCTRSSTKCWRLRVFPRRHRFLGRTNSLRRRPADEKQPVRRHARRRSRYDH
jgi:hypothetical protein